MLSIRSDRLRTALEAHALLQIKSGYVSDIIFENYVEASMDDLPLDLYFDETIFNGDLENSRSELDGTLWFISLLSRVDGLVLMGPTLDVKGFGVEITVREEPKLIYAASNRSATKGGLRKVDYNHYGTRHRSMMRYCATVPGSIGFVVSQDGDVRIMTNVGRRLVVWENIKLQLPDFVRRERHSRQLTGTLGSTIRMNS